MKWRLSWWMWIFHIIFLALSNRPLLLANNYRQGLCVSASSWWQWRPTLPHSGSHRWCTKLCAEKRRKDEIRTIHIKSSKLRLRLETLAFVVSLRTCNVEMVWRLKVRITRSQRSRTGTNFEKVNMNRARKDSMCSRPEDTYWIYIWRTYYNNLKIIYMFSIFTVKLSSFKCYANGYPCLVYKIM